MYCTCRFFQIGCLWYNAVWVICFYAIMIDGSLSTNIILQCISFMGVWLYKNNICTNSSSTKDVTSVYEQWEICRRLSNNPAHFKYIVKEINCKFKQYFQCHWIDLSSLTISNSQKLLKCIIGIETLHFVNDCNLIHSKFLPSHIFVVLSFAFCKA